MSDPYYEKMTVEGQAKKRIIAFWPNVHKTVTWFVGTFWNLLKSFWTDIKRALGSP